MDVERGLLKINGKDMADYGVFLWEKSAAEQKNYDELMRAGETKEQVAVDYRERDGEELPEEIDVRFKARDVTLKFAIVAANRAEWWARYKAFKTLLASGWLTVEVPEIDGVFRFILKSISDHSQFTYLGTDGRQVAGMTVIFREPKPVI